LDASRKNTSALSSFSTMHTPLIFFRLGVRVPRSYNWACGITAKDSPITVHRQYQKTPSTHNDNKQLTACSGAMFKKLWKTSFHIITLMVFCGHDASTATKVSQGTELGGFPQ
jgi:hypothetical protein